MYSQTHPKMTLEDDDTAERKTPAKSILKNKNTNASTTSVPLNDSPSDALLKLQNRRVSFAEKVKLHQIDIVPVSQGSTAEGNSSDGDSESEDFDESFLRLEQAADSIAEAISDQQPNDSEEETMDLTGQIAPIVDPDQLDGVLKFKAADGTQRQTSTEQDPPQISLDIQLPQENGRQDTHNETQEPESANLRENTPTSIQPETQNSHGSSVYPDEEDMDLTTPVNAYPITNPTLPSTNSAEGLLQESSQALDIQATSTQNPEHQNEGPNTVTHPPALADIQEDEVTMDLTNQTQIPQAQAPAIQTQNGTHSNNLDLNPDQITKSPQATQEEITMDLTKVYEKPKEPSHPLDPTVLSPIFPSVVLSEGDEDEPMELTQPMMPMDKADFTLQSSKPNGDAFTNKQSGQRNANTTNDDASNGILTAEVENRINSEINDRLSTMDSSEVKNSPEANGSSTQKRTGEENDLTQQSPLIITNEGTNSEDVSHPKSPSSMTHPADTSVTPRILIHRNEQFLYQTVTPDMDGPNAEQTAELKRKADSTTAQFQKKPHWETQVVTSTIPLADKSMQSDDSDNERWNTPIPHFTLTDFLKEIGIKFYDDLEFRIDLSTRQTLSISESAEEKLKEDYYRANIQLPLLEVYELSCKELAGKIQQGKKLFDELQEKTLNDNPELFKLYYRASFYDQMMLKARFHLLKEYTRQQAKLIWYQWRSKLIQNILEVLQGNLEILQSDKTILINNITILDGLYDEMHRKSQALRREVLQFKEIQSTFQDLDANQIKRIKLQLTELNNRLLEHKKKISEKEEELHNLEDQIRLRNDEIQGLQKEISAAENQLDETKHFNTKEIDILKNKSRLLQAAAGLKFVKSISEHIDEFEFNSEIGVTIDFSKPEASESIMFRLLNLENKVLYNPKLLEYYCLDLVEATGFTNIFESFINFRKKWDKLTLIDEDMYRIALKYPLSILKTEEKEIQFKFQYYSFANKIKTNVVVRIPLKSILQYPDTANIEVDKLAETRLILVFEQDMQNTLPVSLRHRINGAVGR